MNSEWSCVLLGFAPITKQQNVLVCGVCIHEFMRVCAYVCACVHLCVDVHACTC